MWKANAPQMTALHRGLPPPGLLGCARMRSAVSEIRRQKCQIQLWQRDPGGHSAAKLSRIRDLALVVVLWPVFLLSLALALPQVSIQTEGQCGDMRSATGTRPDSHCKGPLRRGTRMNLKTDRNICACLLQRDSRQPWLRPTALGAPCRLPLVPSPAREWPLSTRGDSELSGPWPGPPAPFWFRGILSLP